jgi:ATP-dependent helicase/nuclease subunit B
MKLRFLLGPAGSGKTYRCRQEILAELARTPEGAPLIWLAPKQATFQLERQLLSDPRLPGYVRLFILSFERLAEFLLELRHEPPPPIITEEGRVMVLRALLNGRGRPLEIFHASARLPGFARELSRLLRELQYHRHSPAAVLKHAQQWRGHPSVAAKLRDVAALQRDYQAWLENRRLQDPESLLDTATATWLRPGPAEGSPVRVAGLWLDGFAELSPQEIALLQALAPYCETMTLAFCLENAPRTDPHWLSVWSTVSQAYRKCFQKLSPSAAEVAHEVLPRDNPQGRFAHNPILAGLERNWTTPRPSELPAGQTALRLAACAHPEEEVILAAREIRGHVRQGGRYRECAVLARSLDRYYEAVRRIFPRYQIPFFLDRRESVAHHPLAELTRCALRLAAFDWRHEDWFGALKTGLVPVEEAALDRLENEALARGWEGSAWRHALPSAAGETNPFERTRALVAPPFAAFLRALSGLRPLSEAQPDGRCLAAALEGLWQTLKVKDTLEKWSQPEATPETLTPPKISATAQIHVAVWQQMRDWLENVIQAFAGHPLSLKDWLPIVDAGLSELTVGVIPPALDQVLVGAVDRSRNPDLHRVIVLGMNESLFPATPKTGGLFGSKERDDLALQGLDLASGEHAQMSLERYLAYIACTRACQRLVLTWAVADVDGKTLNPSPVIGQVQRLFSPQELPDGSALPMPASETFSSLAGWEQSEYIGEAIAALSQTYPEGVERHWPELAPLLPYAADWDCATTRPARLSAGLAGRLYGTELRLGITALETYAACPFQFFVKTALRASERREHELDPRRQGSFLHEVLAAFHEGIQEEGRRWRDLAPGEARSRIHQVALDLAGHYQDGLLLQNPANEQTTYSLIEALEEFITITIEWMAQYQFDPAAAELEFNVGPGPAVETNGQPPGLTQIDLFAARPNRHPRALPLWTLELSGGNRLAIRGKIDRVDLRVLNPQEAACVVMDYKSGNQKLEPVRLANGLQLQLPAYLCFLRQLPASPQWFGGRKLRPVGAFYLDLQGHYKSAKSRRDARADVDKSRHEAYRHRGRFNAEALPWLDSRPAAVKGTQFAYQINKDGTLRAKLSDPLPEADFERLLEQARRQIQAMGEAIFQGEIGVAPYQCQGERACDRCECQAICRIDPWTHPFRGLVEPANS